MPLVTINNSILDALKKSNVIPDVIDDFHPSSFIQAEFSPGKEAQLGNTLKKDETQSVPAVDITPEPETDVHASTTYTLCMTDPDAPSNSNPKNSEFCHWLVTDIPSTSGTIDFSKTTELIKFMGPAPPPKTGKHRYVLLFFRDGKKKLEKPGNRGQWGYKSDSRIGARHYAQKYDLTLVGANFFYVQNDEQ